MQRDDHKRIAVLDGWRGLAILFVLIDHVNSGFQGTHRIPSLGQHGVTLFFVLSGYLITGKLLEPKVSLRRFYLRRFWRLMPVAWTFLFVAFLFGASPKELIGCLFFFRNYVESAGQYTPHMWSLSIEEQFYLFWPGLLLLIGSRRAIWLAVAGAFASYGCVLASSRLYTGEFWGVRTEVRLDALLVGCSFALLLQFVSKQTFLEIMRPATIPILLVLPYATLYNHSVPNLTECVGWGALLAGSSLASWPRILAWKPLTWLGRVSYSAYVWNLLVLTLFRRLAWPVSIAWPLACVVILLVAAASYYLIEMPAQRLGAALSAGNVQVSVAA